MGLFDLNKKRKAAIASPTPGYPRIGDVDDSDGDDDDDDDNDGGIYTRDSRIVPSSSRGEEPPF